MVWRPFQPACTLADGHFYFCHEFCGICPNKMVWGTGNPSCWNFRGGSQQYCRKRQFCPEKQEAAENICPISHRDSFSQWGDVCKSTPYSLYLVPSNILPSVVSFPHACRNFWRICLFFLEAEEIREGCPGFSEPPFPPLLSLCPAIWSPLWGASHGSKAISGLPFSRKHLCHKHAFCSGRYRCNYHLLGAACPIRVGTGSGCPEHFSGCSYQYSGERQLGLVVRQQGTAANPLNDIPRSLNNWNCLVLLVLDAFLVLDIQLRYLAVGHILESRYLAVGHILENTYSGQSIPSEAAARIFK